MPGWELIGDEEKNNLIDIFTRSNGVFFAHGFDERRNNIFRVRDLEKNFTKYFGNKECLATTSGTMAQYIAMKGMGIKPGDEVITQSFTFVATIEAILALGAIPKIVDIDDTFNIDPNKIEDSITEKTKLIIPVHMLGNQCKMDEILVIGKKNNIPVMEDACEALGASYRGKKIGTIGDVGVFSLDFAKTITTGEGGLVISNDLKLMKYCREFHDHGHENNKIFPRGKDTRSIYGLNLRMSELQAAVGLAQLKKLNYIVEQNRKNKALLKNNINKQAKMQFRKIVDKDNELADTLIFYFDDKKFTNDFLKKYLELGYGTKNLPDAVDWHFAGTWTHMLKKISNSSFRHSFDLIEKSISIPILVKQTNNEIEKHVEDINNILKSI